MASLTLDRAVYGWSSQPCGFPDTFLLIPAEAESSGPGVRGSGVSLVGFQGLGLSWVFPSLLQLLPHPVSHMWALPVLPIVVHSHAESLVRGSGVCHSADGQAWA